MAAEYAQALVDAIMDKATGDDDSRKLRCADALELAAAHGVAPTAITRVCNKLKIKIRSCQLGCFK